MSSFILPLWAQQPKGFAELFQFLVVLLIFVVPAVIKYFAERTANKDRKRLEEQAVENHLRDVFLRESLGEETSEVTRVRPRPKKERKRKQAELVLGPVDEPPTHGTPLSRGLAPQGEGARFDAQPGTLDASQILSPSIEPTVQPMLESLTGIYDSPPGGEQPAQTPLAVDIYRMLTTPGGIRQAVVLGEILRRPTD